MQSYKSKSQLADPVDFIKRIVIRISVSLVLALIIAYTLKFFFLFPYTIANDFMAPEFKKGSRVYMTYLFQKDKLLIGDVVLVKLNSDASVLLARVVGRKGDRVSIKNKKVFRNGNQIVEGGSVQYTDKRSAFAASFSRRDNFDEVIVKEKAYFLLADNRDEAVDSRELGLISQDSILGKVLF